MDVLFLRTLRLAMYPNRCTNEKNAVSWKECKMLQSEAQKQAVGGILLDGLSKVMENDAPIAKSSSCSGLQKTINRYGKNSIMRQERMYTMHGLCKRMS